MTIRGVLAGAAAVAAAMGVALAANQTILGKSLTAKNPATPDRRKVVVVGKEKVSPNTIVGTPTMTGATLTIMLNGANPTSETFVLNQGTSIAGKPFWTQAGLNGFKYRDPKGEQSAVRLVLIKLAPSGTFTVKAVVAGKLDGSTVLVPPNPGTDGCAVLALTGGDAYHLEYGSDGIVKNVSARLFKVKKPQTEGLCGATSTTTAPPSTTTSTTLYGMPSRAFIDGPSGILD